MTEQATPAGAFMEHPARAAALEELHARPSLRLPGAAQIMRLVFAFDQSFAGRDDALIASLCAESNLPGPAQRARAMRFTWRGLEARWERHNEFVTYTFIAHDGDTAGRLAQARERLQGEQPGPLVAALRLIVRKGEKPAPTGDAFACASLLGAEKAVLETSFQTEADGLVTIALSCSELWPAEIGALAQWALEFETYRTLALLALPIARRVGAMVRDTELLLGGLTRKLADQKRDDDAESLYRQLTELAGRIEAETASSTYRFAAARAYGDIVQDRLARLAERPLDARPMVGAFLTTRLTPALRTCQSMEIALQDLARRTARAADLIRTRIDLDLSRQNVELLRTLNQRTKLQMRLQQTVEGLSVAAVSYYVLGLVGYLAKGAKDAQLVTQDPSVVVAALMPVVVLAIAWAIRRVRRGHSE
jgi:uncharacterized membrane-anchored protein